MKPPDDLFAKRRLVATYDLFEGERPDLDHYEAIVDELAAVSVLDIGCGTGEFACSLARRGLAVIGVDPAEASIDIARSKPGAGLVTWIDGDVTAVSNTGIDVAVMTGNVAQVFVTDQDWMATLDAAAAVIRPGGHLVFETRRPEARAWEGWVPEHTRQSATAADGEIIETWCELLDVSGHLVTFRWTNVFGSDGLTLISDSTLRFRSRDEIESSLAASGFETSEVRDAPDRPGKEMVFIAVRT